MNLIKIPTTRLSLKEADAAYDEWGFNCGPGAMAGLFNLLPAELRPHVGCDFAAKGYMNATMMRDAVEALGVSIQQLYRGDEAVDHLALPWPFFGLVRVQWAGRWTNPGVPMRVRYLHTHWMAVRCPGRHPTRDPKEIAIFDVNTLQNPTPSPVRGWCSLKTWCDILLPHLLPDGATGWWPTHLWEVGGDFGIIDALRKCEKCGSQLKDEELLVCDACPL